MKISNVSVASIFGNVDSKDLQQSSVISAGLQNVDSSDIFGDVDSKDLQQSSVISAGLQSVDSSGIFSASIPIQQPAVNPSAVSASKSDVVEIVKSVNNASDESEMYKKLYEEAMSSNRELRNTIESLNKQLKEHKLKIEFLEQHSKQNLTRDAKAPTNNAHQRRRLSNSFEEVGASVVGTNKDDKSAALNLADASSMPIKPERLENEEQFTQQVQQESSTPKITKDRLAVQQATISSTSLAEDLVTTAIAKKNKWVASKDSFTADGFTFGYVNEELYVLKVDTRTTKVDIPAYVDGIPVRGILGNAFTTSISDVMSTITCAKPKLELIYLPKTITHIDKGAFNGVKCTNLVIPASVNYIAKDAFDGLTCDIMRFACNQKLITSAIAGANVRACVRVEEVVQ